MVHDINHYFEVTDSQCTTVAEILHLTRILRVVNHDSSRCYTTLRQEYSIISRDVVGIMHIFSRISYHAGFPLYACQHKCSHPTASAMGSQH